MSDLSKKSDAYREAGVDIDAGNRAVELIKKHVDSTVRPGVLGGIGGFSGLFTLDLDRYPHPVLVSGTDGVGTKLKLAQMLGKHDTVGIDLVAMCVNDLLVTGAEPLFFLDYLACGRLVPEQVAEVVAGVADGCRQAGCALVGGETAEMPGFYPPGEYDLAGFAVGVVEREEIWDGKRIEAGDLLVGLPSSGVHSNGYSLVRRVIADKELSLDRPMEGLTGTLGEELITPTRIYVKSVLALRERFSDGWTIRGAVHITGGGFTENIPRVLPAGLGVLIERGSWPVQPVFNWLARLGEIEQEEMYRVFNMGIGFVLMVDAARADEVMAALKGLGETPYQIGRVIPGNGVSYS